MKYLGTVRKEQGRLEIPEAPREVEKSRVFEAVEIGGDIILLAGPLEKERWARIEELAQKSMNKHRATLEALSR